MEGKFNLQIERKILIMLFVAIKLNLIEVPRSLLQKCERYRGTDMQATPPFYQVFRHFPTFLILFLYFGT